MWEDTNDLVKYTVCGNEKTLVLKLYLQNNATVLHKISRSYCTEN